MKASRIKSLVAVSCLLLIAAEASAEEKPAAEEPSPRFSLGSPPPAGDLDVTLKIDASLPPPSAFEWKAITANGPSAGSDPIVGAGSGKPYYDFKDGQPYPFYVYTRTR